MVCTIFTITILLLTTLFGAQLGVWLYNRGFQELFSEFRAHFGASLGAPWWLSADVPRPEVASSAFLVARRLLREGHALLWHIKTEGAARSSTLPSRMFRLEAALVWRSSLCLPLRFWLSFSRDLYLAWLSSPHHTLWFVGLWSHGNCRSERLGPHPPPALSHLAIMENSDDQMALFEYKLPI